MRFRVRIDARLRAPRSSGHAATILDVSQGGLLVRLDEAGARALLPNVRRDAPRAPVEVEVSFRAGGQPIEVGCGIAHLRRAPGGGCEIGLDFRRFAPGSAEALERHLLALGAPPRARPRFTLPAGGP